MRNSLSWNIGEKALVLFLPLLVYFLGLAAILVYVELGSDRSVVRDEEKHHVANANNLAKIELKSIFSDLLVLRDSRELATFLAKPSANSLEHLEKSFRLFSLHKGIYDQIRFLDSTGKERVRINYNAGNPIIVPHPRLQDKAKRYYFVDTLKLDKDHIFVSPLDLNVEKGEVERPFKPMIRFGAPVIDTTGRKRGVVLLNYLAHHILDDLDALHDKDYGDWMLLNQDGYWLKAAKKELEWGFMFKARKDIRFSREFPDAWETMALKKNGQFLNERGLFTFETINPIAEGVRSSSGSGEIYTPSSKGISSHDYYWKIVSYVSSRQLDNRIWSRLWRWLVFFSFFIICLGTTSYWLASLRVRRDEMSKDLTASEEKYRRLIDGLPAEHFVFSREINGILYYISPAAEELFGMKVTEMIGRRWDDVIRLLPEYVDISIETDGVCLKNTVPPAIELKYHRSDGSVGILEIHKHPVCEEGGVVTHIEGIAHDVTEKKKLETELEKLATTDPLTGIFNRRRFLEQVSLEQGRSRRYRHGLIFMMLDLDHFKQINDTYSHQAGDEVLIAFASCCKEQLRATDFIGRVGGEEFGILLVEASGEEGMQIAERLRQIVSELTVEFKGQSISFTVSIGLTTFEPDDLFVQDLLNKADSGLYKAKGLGRNCVVQV